MAAEPLPREPISGTCDASGNATLKYRAPAQFYAHCYIAIQVGTGTPTYAVTTGGLPLIFGQGNQTQLGPLLLQPGEVASIIVTGAAPLTTIAGHILGWQAQNPEDLVPLLPLQPTAVLFAPPAGASPLIANTQNGTFTVPTGTAELFIVAGGTRLVGATVVGTQSGATYYDMGVGPYPTPPFPGVTALLMPNDQQVTMSVSLVNGTGGIQVYAVPYVYPFDFGWMRPRSIQPLVGSTVTVAQDNTLIAGSAGQSIYLFSPWLRGSAVAIFELFDGPSADAIPLFETPGGETGPWEPVFQGYKLRTGKDLVARASVTINLFGNIPYTKA